MPLLPRRIVSSQMPLLLAGLVVGMRAMPAFADPALSPAVMAQSAPVAKPVSPSAPPGSSRATASRMSGPSAAPASSPTPSLPPSASTVFTWGDDHFLPFPNDLYTRPDPTTSTGLRLALPEALWSEDLLDRAPFDARLVLERMRQMDGFSPDEPLAISIPGQLRADAFPPPELSARPDSPLILLDLATHSRLPYRHALLPRKDGARRSTMLALMPLDRLENGRHYAVIVRSGLKDSADHLIAPPPGFSQALAGTSAAPDIVIEPWQAHLQTLGTTLKLEGFEPADVALAFDFTVESKESFTHELSSMVARITQQRDATPYRVTHFKQHRRLFVNGHKASIRVTGSFQTLKFFDDRGVKLKEPGHEEVRFLLEMPEVCPEGGCAVAIFGHGLGATKESMFQVADRFAQQGIATVGIGAPYHTNMILPMKVIRGSRKNLDLLHGVMIEHVLRNIQLVQLIEQDLASPGRNYRTGTSALPPLKLRGDRLFYIGQSLGGICGVATTAMSPEIRASIFDVAGGGGVDLIFDSWVARLMRLPLLNFNQFSASENNLIVPLAVNLFDDLDPLGFAPYVVHNTLQGARPRWVSQQAGRGDGLVPNWTSEKLSRALGIPLIRPANVAETATTDAPGPGLRYFRFTSNFFMNHLELMKSQSSTAAATFFAWTLKQLEPSAVSSNNMLPPDEAVTAASQ